jgi:hypothetical protein
MGRTVVKQPIPRHPLLSGLGCQSFQGYLISPAMPLVEFEGWLTGHSARPIIG